MVCIGKGIRRALTASLAVLAFVIASPAGALELRVTAWNLEHLDDTNGSGCVGRDDADYTALSERIDELGVGVLAFQEVENVAAAERVFDAERWSVEISARASTGTGPPCNGRPEARLGHLATGIAVREGLDYTRHDDFSALAGGNRYLRWGTDITVTRDGDVTLTVPVAEALDLSAQVRARPSDCVSPQTTEVCRCPAVGRARSVDSIGSLELAHVGDNLRDVGFRDAWNGRHVAELPVVAYHTELDCAVERGVRVMPRLVDAVHERWALSGARCALAVAQRAAHVEQGGARVRRGVRARVMHPPCPRAEHGDGECRADGDHCASSTSARGAETALFGLAQARAARAAQRALSSAHVQRPHAIAGICRRAITTMVPFGISGVNMQSTPSRIWRVKCATGIARRSRVSDAHLRRGVVGERRWLPSAEAHDRGAKALAAHRRGVELLGEPVEARQLDRALPLCVHPNARTAPEQRTDSARPLRT